LPNIDVHNLTLHVCMCEMVFDIFERILQFVNSWVMCRVNIIVDNEYSCVWHIYIFISAAW